ncbi:DUF445 domain-containing protein [Brevibacillus sp. TJ4]|uniref:DUF445 domain-containing protein n=1 Tax=Brevibacillus sp. TJ4 TaxID=3234853 RepID=UPI0037D7814D
MNSWLILLNIAIGSLIGGFTNHVAIRMLFRPLRPWYIGNWRVPFTPGLIPSRRDEIARQMGRLVAEHLLTAEGVKRAITQGDMEKTLVYWLQDVSGKWMAEERTLRQLVRAAVPQVLDENGRWSESLRAPVARHWHSFVQRLLARHEDKQLRELLSDSGVQRLEASSGAFSELLLTRVRDYLHSPQGHQTLQTMVRSLLGGGGGMFGGFVGMFLGDDKVIGKLLPHLDELLQGKELHGRLEQFIRQEIDKLLDKRVGEVVAWIGAEQVEEWTDALFAKLEDQSLRLLDEPLSKLTQPIREPLLNEAIPRLARWLLDTVERNAERVFSSLPVSEIVTRQVEGFPIERIEQMVLGISGKEFRMITILGFVLGGMIGLVQGLLSMWLG